MVFQNYALFPTMTVYENIAFGKRVKNIRAEIDQDVREIARKVDLKEEQLFEEFWSCPAVNSNGLPSPGRSYSSRPSWRWMSLCRTWTPNCAYS